MSIGLLPGAPVRLLRRSPAYVVALGESEFALDEDMAKAIYVRVQTNRQPTAAGRRERTRSGWRWGNRGNGGSRPDD
jgi:hypothetical protein